jgi:EmrB/QacA subfamily drug resistance transporter
VVPRTHLPALVLLSAASFMAVVDTTIVSIALPTIRHQLGFSAAGVQWVLNAYALVFGGLLLLLGRAGDLVGRRLVFEAGLLLFAAASVLAGAAGQPWMLVAGRFLQGAGAAAFVPASLSLLTSTFTGHEERSRALAVYGSIAALGFVVGMVGGGAITAAWGWRWIFFVNVPVALPALLCSRRLLNESREPAHRGLDLAGAASVTAGLVLLIFAMTSAPSSGWSSPGVIVTMILGVACLVAFVAVERRHPAPLMPPDVVARLPVLVPNGALALESMVGISWLYLLTLYFQEVRGEDAQRTGLLFVPMTLASVAAAAVAGRAAVTFGLRRTAMAGLGLVLAGLLAMAGGMSSGSTALLVVVGMVVGEGGFMLANVPLTIAGTSSIENRRAGLAAGLLNTSIQLGSAVGLAVVAVVVALASQGAPSPDVGALRQGVLTCAVFCLLALAIVAGGLHSPSPMPADEPSPPPTRSWADHSRTPTR